MMIEPETSLETLATICQASQRLDTQDRNLQFINKLSVEGKEKQFPLIEFMSHVSVVYLMTLLVAETTASVV
jgi:hypothetical protein